MFEFNGWNLLSTHFQTQPTHNRHCRGGAVHLLLQKNDTGMVTGHLKLGGDFYTLERKGNLW